MLTKIQTEWNFLQETFSLYEPEVTACFPFTKVFKFKFIKKKKAAVTIWLQNRTKQYKIVHQNLKNCNVLYHIVTLK